MLSIIAIVMWLFSKVSTYPELGQIRNWKKKNCIEIDCLNHQRHVLWVCVMLFNLTEICAGRGVETLYFPDGNCKTYWNCTGSPHPVCCKDGMGYDMFSGRCVVNSSCTDPCPTNYQGRWLVKLTNISFIIRHDKTSFCQIRTTKAQISRRIRAVWSASLLFAAWIV